MNDLEYRRKQLLKLQDAVIDLEDLSTGVSIADVTLTDFRIDLAHYLKAHPGVVENLPLGICSVLSSSDSETAPGIIFCLRAETESARDGLEEGYPLGSLFLVHVGNDGTVLLPYTQAKNILDRMKRLCHGREELDSHASTLFDTLTRQGEDMRSAQGLLAAAVASVAGKHVERAVASLFSPGGTQAMKGEFVGINDFEVVAWLVILPDAQSEATR